MKTKRKIILAIIYSLIILAIGFLLGRSMSTVVTKIEYVKEPPITGVLHNLTPIREVVPVVPDLPKKKDTFYINNVIYAREVVDTAAIIAEYELRRTYELPMFDNQYGKLDMSLDLQYNRLDSVRFEFIPIMKIQTKTIERPFVPFVSGSYLSTGYAGFGGGFFYKKVGVEYQRLLPMLPDRQAGNMFNVKYRF